MPLNPMQTIIKEFDTYYAQALKKPMPDLVPFEKKLRVSSMPYCGLKDAHSRMTGYVEPDSDAMKSYYCDVGTAAHTVFQRWLGAHGRIYGDWKCLNSNCGRFVRFSNKHKCPDCGSEMLYEEFTVKAFKHLSGHLDGLFRARDRSFWVIDYKTSSERAINSQKYNKTFPYTKNRHQIESYVPLIEEELDLEVSGWMLNYIARDNPSVRKIVGASMSTKYKKEILAGLESYDTQYGIVQRLKNYKQLQYLVDNKFCQSHEHYNTDMKGFNGCALAPVCFGKRLKSVLRLDMDQYLEACKTKED